MGKRIKSRGQILDASSTASAPLSPTGTVALRAKPDATQFQYSASGGAWTDIGMGSGSTPRLDEVLDPNIPGITPPAARIKTFEMADHQLVFHFAGTESEECFVIESTSPVTPGAGGSVLLLRASGSTSEKSPLRIEGRGAFYFSVGAEGKVAIGSESGLVNKLTITHVSAVGADETGAIQAAVTLSTGNAATSIAGATFGISDNGNTTALTSATGLNLLITRTSSGVSNTGLTARLINGQAFLSASTGTVQGLYFKATTSAAAVVTTWQAIYIAAPAILSGSITNSRAIVTESGAGNVGFGTTSPAAQLHVSGSVQLDLGSDARGDVFYRSSGGTLSRLAVGTSTQVLTITDIGGGVLEPRWTTPAGGGGSGNPGGSASELQFRSTGTAFGAVTGSAVSGANVSLVGDLTFERTGATYSGNYSTIIFRREEASSGVIVSGQPIGGMTFFGRLVSVGIVQLGGISSYWDNTTGGANNLGVLRLVARDGTQSRIEIFDSGSTKNGVNLIAVNGSISLSVQDGGIGLAGHAGSATTGALYYRNSSGFIAGLQSTAGFLKATGTNVVPTYAALDGGDITTGTVALARGGTGASLTDPNVDRIMFWDDSAGAVTWLQVSTGLDLTGTVLTATGGAGGSPGGSGSELQYRSGASTFGAVANTAVSGANVTLGGTVTMDAAGVQDQTIALSALTANDTRIVFTEYKGAATPISLQFDRSRGSSASPTNLTSGDVIAQLQFRGRVSSAFAQQGYLRSLWTTTDGGSVELGAGGTSGAGTRFVATVNSGAGIFDTAGNSFTVSGSGFAFSHGTTGSIYYRSSGGLFTALTIGSTSQYLKGGTTPSWGGIDGSHITSGTVALVNGGTGAPLADPNADRIMFWDDSAGAMGWLVASTGLNITATTLTATGTPPAGSGSELQYRNAGVFGAVTNSSVDGSGVITYGGGSGIWKNDTAVSLNLRLYNSTAALATQINTLKSRGTEISKSAILSGDALFLLAVSGQSDASTQRDAGRIAFDAVGNFSTTSAPSVFRVRTSHVNSAIPLERMVLGGAKTLTDNTLTDLFTITFNSADQLAIGGEIHLLFVAKQVSGTVHTYVHRRVISFGIAHNANLDTVVTFTEVQQHRAGGASDDAGLAAISHALNSDAAVSTGTNIPSTPNAYATNAITYKVLADATLTLSQLTCYYHVIYHGEAEIVLS